MKTTWITSIRIPHHLVGLWLALALFPLATVSIQAGEGPFKPEEESLMQYECPEWFRDAKFGIWAVWGAETVPMQADWYARRMYLHDEVNKEGKQVGQNSANKYHLEHYGHPSEFGFKDIIPLWKAENWDPEALMARYKKAGAKYFCMIAMHHDNYDCWDSNPIHRWNSVNMGPKRDIAAEWAAAARKEGLKFGMTEHLAASWWFYSAAHSADKTGPMAGVPYDGNDPRYADLYWTGNENPDFRYYSENVPEYVKKTWYDRVKIIVDRYHPDLLYSDSPLPYPDDYGRKLVAHYYNDNMARNNGRLEAVYTCKQESNGRWVRDLERGVMDGIHPDPWQTDTCVGTWYYSADFAAKRRYKSAKLVVDLLCDIVSKNGNLLLNFPPRPDGTLDDQELAILDRLAEWMPVHGEGIYATRPWLVYGEGPERVKKGENFNERGLEFDARDIRFTRTKDGKTLYAFVLGWPENDRVVIRTLAKNAGRIRELSMLGYEGQLDWRQTSEGLVVNLPREKRTNMAIALKMPAGGLRPAK